MSTATKLRVISTALRINKTLDRDEILTALEVIIDLAERIEKLETVCPGRR